MEKVLNYIGGELLPARSGGWLDKPEPATAETYAHVPDSDASDVQRAVEAAARAFPAWAATPATERSRMLRRIADGIRSRLDDFARAESIDTGKPLSVASTVDIPRSILNFEFFADAVTQFSSEAHQTDDVALNYTLRAPLGVVGCISPWNLPLYLLTWKIAPALAMGNCVVAKPSEVTPMTAYLLAQVCRDVGLPPGVLNLVHGLGPKVGAAMSEHPDISAISFTGSTRTGAEIARVAAPAFKKLSLEMGGKNPNVIFADCDFDEALATTLRSSFANQGQICLCGPRIFVQRPLYERFKEALVTRTRALKVGDPLEAGTDQGALVSQPHFDKVLGYVSLAKQEGGRILTGGQRANVPGRCRNGWFVEPTLIEGLDAGCRTNQEEIFGPVASIMPFDSEDEVLAWANSTKYGLAASVWTQDVKRAHRFASRLHSGIVWVNTWMLRDLRTPFGGVKDSGVGREGGWDALRFFTEPKNVCIKL
ncbi:aldehyde dehydrogenase [Myxococcus xanthus]|uniref:2-hydroxymuconic semialdehyde dehydrogenase n=1 Tax=Myxococcus xanthus TaxID=34 RepID=A0AAE6FWC3_MYXXA|nr:aldehyde dehydrogenase [Myxococcus xanthus]QDE66360.1 2-hydroxymuconic semialdehyde dehydrogenase [Myxococcus xanthus]QDE73633.1 2-hydroxymuconic semialdehyde dehydrogenase [Myxococcus xanthus]QDE80896.1 2-hydroxymuconic semialdehyde dehydrogenase [Myxococcus xanthus]QDF02504.1 2-hydroxymuconic semialdehyde dehydrogenase [Myxococcus xanthus]